MASCDSGRGCLGSSEVLPDSQTPRLESLEAEIA